MKAFPFSCLLALLFLSSCGEDKTLNTDTPAQRPAASAPAALPSTGTPAGTATRSKPTITPTGDAGESSFVPAGYSLVWSDEFDYEGLPDESKWDYQTGGFGWTAKELQNYLLADPDNVGVENGTLRITARAEKSERNNYTSTRLVSKKKAAFTRGYFEIRAQLPSGPGLRSSFWMVGDTVSKIGWPDAGEIDLVEHYGKFPTVVNAAVQTPDGYWSKKTQEGGSKIVKNAETAFNVYSCEWTETELKFAVNGEVYWTYPAPPGRGIKGYPFRWPFYMAATLAVGGIRGPQTPPVPEAFPASMYLDYVRVYQR